VPLGATPRASVFLVREGTASPRLLRLKVWHAPAAPGFLERFDHLRIRLERWRGSPIALPLAASLDSAGCPSVLSEFRQGVPILDAVRARRIKAGSAWTLIRPVIDVLLAMHEEGLGHGALVSGNVLLEVGPGSTHLVDFGLAALLDPMSVPAAVTLSDRNGLAALGRAVRAVRRT
jgi:serine/threonine protein kinase